LTSNYYQIANKKTTIKENQISVLQGFPLKKNGLKKSKKCPINFIVKIYFSYDKLKYWTYSLKKIKAAFFYESGN
jgi:hypothetical protein